VWLVLVSLGGLGGSEMRICMTNWAGEGAAVETKGELFRLGNVSPRDLGDR
jgi:hypothetical protein